MREWAISMFLLPALLSCLVAAGGLHAQVDACGEERDAGTHALDEFSWKRLNAVHEAVGEEQYDEAYEDLRAMLERAGSDDYLRAVINLSLAQVEWARERFDPALGYFERAVELDVLPDFQHFGLMYQIAQLYYMRDRYDEALNRLALWFCKVSPGEVTSHAYVLQASIYLKKENYAGTLAAIETAITMDEDPKESWYQLKLAAHFEQQQFSRSADTLKIMIDRWPEKKIYWLQLAQVYLTLEQLSDALAVLALAHRKNLLDEQSDITLLSSLYSNQGIPLKAAQVLETGIRDGVVQGDTRHWTRVADAWYAAEELDRALPAYAEAGRTSDSGSLDLRRGYLLVDLERWAEAVAALDRALDKGGLDERETGEIYLLRGVAHFNQGDFALANADWVRAGRYDRTRDSARQWLNHLREERQRASS